MSPRGGNSVARRAEALEKKALSGLAVLASPQAIVANSISGLLLDMHLPDGNGIDWIEEVRETQPGTAIIAITGDGDIPLAVEAMRRGADQFLTKPVDLEELKVFLRKSLEVGGLRRRSRAQSRLSRKTSPAFGSSASMKALVGLAEVAAANDTPVLLLGETGSGKGVLARWIHEHSARQSQPFVELSCAGLRGDPIASELFGHARGAFTSAVSDREGVLDVADGGTLFLDEIGEQDPSVQAQFLKVLEEKRYRRLGEVRERRSEFRLICATNRDLSAEVQNGGFRSDLHFRINVFPMTVPPLRQRIGDLDELVDHVLASFGRRLAISQDARANLRGYSWPGNVRELRNVLERATLLAPGGQIEPNHLTGLTPKPAEAGGREVSTDEKARIQHTLDQHDGNVDAAAQALGLSRATLYRRLNATLYRRLKKIRA